MKRAPKRKVVIVDAGTGRISIESLAPSVLGPVSASLLYHNRYNTHAKDVYSPDGLVFFGIGPFAGSMLGGPHRLTFFSRSPLTGGLFPSTMGGAGLALYKAGIDFVALTGKSKKPVIIAISSIDGKLKAEFHELKEDELEKVYKGYKGRKGVFALEKHAFETFRESFTKDKKLVPFRVFSAGPAALATNYGAMGSTVVEPGGKFAHGRVDWAGRGGTGSLMARAHNVVALMIGGNSAEKRFVKDLSDAKVVNGIFEKVFGRRMAPVVTELTEKYRYSEKLKSGGTFGSNMVLEESSLPFFNWLSTYMPVKDRQKAYDGLVKNAYLKEFNRRVIKPKSWRTCGEACLAVCKKVDETGKKSRKIDYEPYEANGPNSGIFDLDAAESVVSLVDELGFGAIEFGNIASFVLEAKWRGLLTDNEVKGKAVFDLKEYLKDPAKHSREHARIIRKVAEITAEGKGIGRYLGLGVREASKILDKKYKSRVKDIGFNDMAFYVAEGERGSIVPCQYWVPGFMVPVPVQGKFLTYYGADFVPPCQLGMKAGSRMIAELGLDNLGICRFHRAWSEKAEAELFKAALGHAVDYRAYMVRMIHKLIDYNRKCGAVPQPLESRRSKEVLASFFRKTRELYGSNEELDTLISKFDRSLDSGAYLWWTEALRGVERVLGKPVA